MAQARDATVSHCCTARSPSSLAAWQMPPPLYSPLTIITPPLCSAATSRSRSSTSCSRRCAQLQAPVIASIADAVQRAPDRLKPQLASLIAPHYPRDSLHAMGFSISPTCSASARRHARVVSPGAAPPSPPQPPSRQPLSARGRAVADGLPRRALAACCVSYRAASPAGVVVPALILSLSYAELHRLWSVTHDAPRSLTTFTRAVRQLRVYKPLSKRMTDACDHCMEGRRHHAVICFRLSARSTSPLITATSASTSRAAPTMLPRSTSRRCRRRCRCPATRLCCHRVLTQGCLRPRQALPRCRPAATGWRGCAAAAVVCAGRRRRRGDVGVAAHHHSIHLRLHPALGETCDSRPI